MDADKLINRSVDLLREVEKIEAERQKSGVSLFQVNNVASRGAHLIHSVTGSKSVYADNLKNAQKEKLPSTRFFAVAGVLQAFHFDLTEGNLTNIRQDIEAVVVSEILSQAKKLLKTKSVHPASGVMVACAAVEEFLRNWSIEKGINIPEKQRSISRYVKELRKIGQIDLPVERRIQSWADYRNDAAHGSNWENITQEIANRLVREIEDFIIENREIYG